MNTGSGPARILVVCSHNRTRSVMVEAMLRSMLDERLGAGVVAVSSAGFGPPGLPPIADAVAAMAERGLDVSAHLSSPITPAVIEEADLVLTAERDHVVRIATMSRAAFPRTMTLPEFVDRSAGVDDGSDLAFREWIERVGAGRTTDRFLRDQVGEIADPTGWSPGKFAEAVQGMHDHCDTVAFRIAARHRG